MSTFMVAGTGSRSLQTAPRPVRDAAVAIVMEEVTRLKDKYGDRLWIMSGMAEGFDKLLAVVALQLEVPLFAAVPNKTYGEYYWGKRSLTGKDKMQEFADILAKAHEVKMVCETPVGSNGKFGGANFDRNTFMVEKADAFLVWDPTSVGTSHCVRAIDGAGKPKKVLFDGHMKNCSVCHSILILPAMRVFSVEGRPQVYCTKECMDKRKK